MMPTRTLPPPLPRRADRTVHEDAAATRLPRALPELLEAQRRVTGLAVLLSLLVFWTASSLIYATLSRTFTTLTAAFLALTAVVAVGRLKARRRLRELRQLFEPAS